MSVKAIETEYAGCRFRSRLEARWAVFFDELKIAWKYEPQGFYIDEHIPEDEQPRCWTYLPDFYLPETQTWVEVKGNWNGVGKDYLDMLANAIDWYPQLPHIQTNHLGGFSGLLLLGDIPRPSPPYTLDPAYIWDAMQSSVTAFPLLQHQQGVSAKGVTFIRDKTESACGWLTTMTDHQRVGPTPNGLRRHAILPQEQTIANWLWRPYSSLHYGILSGHNFGSHLHKYAVVGVDDAYRKARSARFEHGETP